MDNPAAAATSFTVRVYYREPTYELKYGARPDPFFWDYQISAVDEAAALAQALREFTDTAAHSGVGWVRRVVQMDVRDCCA